MVLQDCRGRFASEGEFTPIFNEASDGADTVAWIARQPWSSSNFPRFDRNTNTGRSIETETEREFVQAVNRVYHDSAHPSHLILPIIERD